MKWIITFTVLLIVAVTVYRVFNPHQPTLIFFKTSEVEQMAQDLGAKEAHYWRLQDGHVVGCDAKACHVSGYIPAGLTTDEIKETPSKITHWFNIDEKHLRAWNIAIEKSKLGGKPELVLGFIECTPEGCLMRLP